MLTQSYIDVLATESPSVSSAAKYLLFYRRKRRKYEKKKLHYIHNPHKHAKLLSHEIIIDFNQVWEFNMLIRLNF